MPESTPAVFLSYASQDAAAATRMAEALRAAGIDVWFDQSELRGGDSWDNEIRRQIRECALFIPIISSNAQCRVEGYFRREWKLADERTQDMGKRRAFLVPVCIDASPDQDADVPDSFLKVQWTTLPEGNPTPEFVQRVAQLLQAQATPEPSSAPAQAVPVARPPTASATASQSSPPPIRRSALSLYLKWVALVVTVALVAFFWPRGQSEESATLAEVLPQVEEPTPTIDPVIAAASRDKSIAVLPFDNRSRKEDDEFFTEGIHDDLLTQISRIHEIKTISRTSVLAYRDTTKNMRQIGEELGVATILEGGVQRAGNQVRINVQLIDTSTDAHLWAETYTREMTAENIFAIQSEISVAIATALRAVLSPAEEEQLAQLPTDNLAALELYFKAGTMPMTIEGLERRIELSQQAIDLDPEFTLAIVRKARALLDQIYFSGLAIKMQIAKARPLVERALELDKLCGEAHAARGAILYYQQENELAEKSYQRAIELNPNDAEAHADYASLKTWRFEDHDHAIKLIQRAQELDPESINYQRIEAEIMIEMEEDDAARNMLNRLVEEHPNNALVLGTVGKFHATRGENGRALIALRKAHAVDPLSPIISLQIADIYETIKDRETQAFWLERSFQRTPEEERRLPHRIEVHRHHGEWEIAEKLWQEYWETDQEAAKTYLNWMMMEDMNAGRTTYIESRLETAYDSWLDPNVAGPENREELFDALFTGWGLWTLGKVEQANRLFDKSLDTSIKNAPSFFVGMIKAAVATITLSEDEAMDAVAAAADQGVDGIFFINFPFFDRLHEHPRFQQMFAGDLNWMKQSGQAIRDLEATGTLAPIPDLPEDPL